MVLYQITSLIDAITYTSKPYICEYPTVSNQIFNHFTRAIRVRPSRRSLDELGIQRTHEGDNSHQIYDIQMRFASYSDMKTTFEEFWQGVNDLDPEEYYSWVKVPDIKEYQGDGEFVVVTTAVGNRSGKQIGSD